MLTFEVKDMTCGHCVNAITQAVASVDPRARLEITLASHRVQIESAVASEDVFGGAIRRAGFTPVRAAGTAPEAVKAAPRKGCCCG